MHCVTRPLLCLTSRNDWHISKAHCSLSLGCRMGSFPAPHARCSLAVCRQTIPGGYQTATIASCTCRRQNEDGFSYYYPSFFVQPSAFPSNAVGLGLETRARRNGRSHERPSTRPLFTAASFKPWPRQLLTRRQTPANTFSLHTSLDLLHQKTTSTVETRTRPRRPIWRASQHSALH